MSLISRLRAATGSDRELDAEIFRRFGNAPKEGKGPFDWRYVGRGTWEKSEFNQPAPPSVVKAPAYTASLDAAMTLVPEKEGWWAEIHHRPDGPGVVLWQFPLPCGRIPAQKPYQISGRTTALALCIAALMARGEAGET